MPPKYQVQYSKALQDYSRTSQGQGPARSGQGGQRQGQSSAQSERQSQGRNTTQYQDAALAIIVYKGDAIDSPSQRHTGLLIRYMDKSSWLVHINGTVGMFELPEAIEKPDPTRSRRFAGMVPVAKVSGKPKGWIEAFLKQTPVKQDRDWNCQNWVGDALIRASNQGLITTEQRTTAIGKMADIVTDAPDED